MLESLKPISRETAPCKRPLFALKAWAVLVVFAVGVVVSHSQPSPDTIRLNINPDLRHPENVLLERLKIVNPAVYANDFIRSFSTFDTVWFDLTQANGNTVLVEDIQFRSHGPKSFLSLTLSDNQNSITFEPVLGFRLFADKNGKRFSRRSNGLKAYGWLGSNITFYASALDNIETGKFLDRRKELEPTKGFVVSDDRGADGFGFDETEVQLGYSWGFGQLFVEKIRNRWGYGESGNLVLSEKPPSFPQVRLTLKIVDGLKFTFLHGFLYSNVVDSSQSYRDGQSGIYRKVFRSKYIASHVLEYSPDPSWNFALGESVVFSDQYQPVYLLPLAFFRSAEHQNRDTDNAQIFAGVRYTLEPYALFYGTLFVDDINTDKLFSEDALNIVAWTLGAKYIDLLVPNLDVSVEYTALRPWVYTHQFEATTFTSSGYLLGHWLGHNAELLSASISYRFMRSLWLSMYVQRMRKGILPTIRADYSRPWEPDFLAGDLFRKNITGFASRWEIYRSVIFYGSVTMVNQADDLPNRFPRLTNDFFLDLGIFYNLFE